MRIRFLVAVFLILLVACIPGIYNWTQPKPIEIKREQDRWSEFEASCRNGQGKMVFFSESSIKAACLGPGGLLLGTY